MGEELRRGGAWGEMGKGERGAAGKKGDAGALAREARRAEAEHTQRAQATGRVLSTSACARLLQRPPRGGARAAAAQAVSHLTKRT